MTDDATLSFLSALTRILTRHSVYYLFWPGGGGRRGQRDKIGCTGNGKERLKYYLKQFKDVVMPTIISLLNINAIPDKVQELVTKKILEGLATFLPSELPVTIADATRLEMTGLPVHTILFFWSMVMNYGACMFLGGGILMNGFLLRLYLMIIESGLQVFLKKGGDTTASWDASSRPCARSGRPSWNCSPSSSRRSSDHLAASTSAPSYSRASWTSLVL